MLLFLLACFPSDEDVAFCEARCETAGCGLYQVSPAQWCCRSDPPGKTLVICECECPAVRASTLTPALP